MHKKSAARKKLGDMISIADRFHRSVNLIVDWEDPLSLKNYIITPTVESLATRITEESIRDKGTRAWSIIGPYGTGKSAFALFMTDLFCRLSPIHPTGQKIKKKLKLTPNPYLPLLIIAERKALKVQITECISKSFESIDVDFSKKARKLLENQSISGNKLNLLIVEASKIAKENNYGGLLIIIDEFGKFLEYAAAKPEERDLLFIQSMAEIASRSDFPIVLMNFLHMGFSDYLPRHNEIHRKEWQKVHGRFHDIAFQLPLEQLLQLVSIAIRKNIPSKISNIWNTKIRRILKAKGLIKLSERVPIKRILPDCLPLNPFAALLLWPLFRSKLSQNERSLFAFLASNEPFGFRDFLNKTPVRLSKPELSFYGIPQLYNYVKNSLVLGAFRGDQGRRWAEIERAISRITIDSPDACIPLIKSIGLISAYGSQIGLDASEEILYRALPYTRKEIKQALSYLTQKSIVVYRKFKKSYSLWQGSDIDLDSLYAEARRSKQKKELSTRLEENIRLRPIVARAHYIETGTLRYFSIKLAPPKLKIIKNIIEKNIKNEDGLIIFIIGQSLVNRSDFINELRSLTEGVGRSLLRLIAIPDKFLGIEEALLDLEAWKWIKNNVQELKGDEVARNEVKSRISYAQEKAEKITGEVLGATGHFFQPELSQWFQDGKYHNIQSAQDFQKWISLICNEVFDKAPDFHNELLNRQSLSSSASAARRNLIEAMLKNPEKERLGIEGTPAEVSMYLSMLKSGGFHVRNKNIWEFSKPDDDWLFAWQKISSFLKNTKNQRRSVNELFDSLKKPPIGLRAGPIPVLFMAYYKVFKNEIALYEDGVYVPIVSIEVIERLLSRPETFEIQTYSLSSKQREVLRELNEKSILGKNNEDVKVEFLPIVKNLVYQASKLNPYTQKTNNICPLEAGKVRDVLLNAKSPMDLLFRDLPKIFDLDLNARGNIKIFSEQLKKCMNSLNRTYPSLLDTIEKGIRDALDLPDGPSIAAIVELKRRATPLVNYAVEDKLQIFVREAKMLNNKRDWREVLGRVIQGGMPPSHWTDKDAGAFQIKLKQVAGAFHRLEELVAEQEDIETDRIFRLGVLNPGFSEHRAVVSIDKTIKKEVVDLHERLQNVISESLGNDKNQKRIKLAALAETAETLIAESEND